MVLRPETVPRGSVCCTVVIAVPGLDGSKLGVAVMVTAADVTVDVSPGAI
jgi:hypothetical protein